MSSSRKSQTKVGESLQQKLERLRIYIDAMSEAPRPHLIEFAEAIFGAHQQLQNKVTHNHEAD
jgi:hypothetical protein